MSHSNSSLNTFAACQKKYEHSYILETPPCKPSSVHLAFGTMAHMVLRRASELQKRGESAIDAIPKEDDYGELKNEFGINDWKNYFVPIIKGVKEIQDEEIKLLQETGETDIEVYEESDMRLTANDLLQLDFDKKYLSHIQDEFHGIIDRLILGQTHATILDFKFTDKRKNQNDLDMNSQLYLYAAMVASRYDIPIYNIRVGYIDIPKVVFGMPRVLSNGQLSRDKSQNVSQDNYEKAIQYAHGDDPVYNCKPGGYYYDCWCALALNRAVYPFVEWVDVNVYKGIMSDLIEAACAIERMVKEQIPFTKKYDVWSCGNCEYVEACKPWRKVQFEEAE